MHNALEKPFIHSFILSFIRSFIQAISIAPLQAYYYSEALPTQHGYCVGDISIFDGSPDLSDDRDLRRENVKERPRKKWPKTIRDDLRCSRWGGTRLEDWRRTKSTGESCNVRFVDSNRKDHWGKTPGTGPWRRQADVISNFKQVLSRYFVSTK